MVGQEAITRTLRNAIKERRISHAYLFNGPRGTGKTTAAKIFAKAVNCLEPIDGEPCNTCAACQGIMSGEILDIMEIDAASNRGVDEIRDLRDKVNLSPSSLKYKVYIIDEVHMLTTEAFNALLKTLEEPPGHVIFILATTEVHKLPLTIISRCQRFDFHKIALPALVGLLQSVCDRQGIRVSKETLLLIARYSEGGGRDALSVLDQAYSFSGDEITVEDIHLITGTLSGDFLRQFVQQLVDQQRTNVLRLLDEILAAGKDPDQIMKNFIQYLRDILIYQNAPELEEMKSKVALEPEFAQLAHSIDSEWLFSAIEHLSRVQNDMKYSAHPRILFEVALIQLMEQESKATPVAHSNVDDQLIQQIQQLEKRIHALEQRQVTGEGAQTEVRPEEERKRITTSSDLPLAKLKSIYQLANEKYLARIIQLWPEILEGVRIQDVRAAAWLKQGKPVVATEEQILLAFNSAIHRESTDQPANKRTIESTLYDRTNIRFEIVTIMQDQWEEFYQKQQHNENERDETSEDAPLDPIVAEAYSLVGEELVRIKK